MRKQCYIWQSRIKAINTVIQQLSGYVIVLSLSILSKICKQCCIWQPRLKGINIVIQQLSGYTIIISLVLYSVGHISGMRITTDDMIWDDIKGQIPENAQILEAFSSDLHGYGNNSIIIAIGDKKRTDLGQESQVPNEVLILDNVESDFLKYFYRLFKIGSSYIVKYRFPLDEEKVHWSKIKLESIDLTGDKVKDLIIYRITEGGSAGSIYANIISWQNGQYTRVGIFPPLNLDSPHVSLRPIPNISLPSSINVDKPPLPSSILDNNRNDQPSSLGSSENLSSITLGSKVFENQKKYFEARQRSEAPQTDGYHLSLRTKFIDIDNDGHDELVVYRPIIGKDESNADNHIHRIEVYKPYMKENILLWDLIFCKTTPLRSNKQKYLDDFLLENY